MNDELFLFCVHFNTESCELLIWWWITPLPGLKPWQTQQNNSQVGNKLHPQRGYNRTSPQFDGAFETSAAILKRRNRHVRFKVWPAWRLWIVCLTSHYNSWRSRDDKWHWNSGTLEIQFLKKWTFKSEPRFAPHLAISRRLPFSELKSETFFCGSCYMTWQNSRQ